MPTCFVIQPFDGGKFDKRFADIYEPAIRAAELEPYRVDQDPGVDVPIEAIEAGIRNATVCLADITTDNPNVWYELGFALASGRPVVMVCAKDERTGKKYPFDIQHRTIIEYQAEAPRDFDKLKANIADRIKAVVKKTDQLRIIQANEQVAPVDGLSQPELAIIAVLVGNVGLPDEGVPAYVARSDIDRAGFTAAGFTLGVQRLQKKGFIKVGSGADRQGNECLAIFIQHEGWEWISHNEDKFMLRRPTLPDVDDVPF